MGVMDRIRSIFGGAPDDKAIVDKDGDGLDDQVDEEIAINEVNADLAAERDRDADRMLNIPGVD